jgi:hypothetical protein
MRLPITEGIGKHQETRMRKKLVSFAALSALLALPLAANAQIYQFNATLNAANEVPTTASTATGVATLQYDTHNTASLLDDTYSFSEAVFGLTGPATGYHIHASASPTETAPVRINFASTPGYLVLVSGNNLLVGAANLPAPVVIPATPATGTNAGYPAMSFLSVLQSGLAYVNVHTATYPGGEVRGQLLPVSPIPEPATSMMLLAGAGIVGLVARRRRTPR